MISGFIIAILGVSLVASMWPHRYPQTHRYAGRHYYRPQFALLAGSAILYIVWQLLEYKVNPFVSVVFWLLWLVGLIVAVTVESRKAFFTVLTTFLLGALLVWLGSSYQESSPQSSAAASNTGSVQTKAATAGTGTTPKTCEAKFEQKWDPNTEFRFASNGLWDNPQTHQITAPGAASNQQALAGHDARYLAGTSWSVSLWDDPNKVAPLLTANKACLSTEGIALYNKLVAKWHSATKTEITAAPAAGVNTGSDNGTYVVNGSSGISGDRTSIKRTYPNGKVSYDLARCGNNVLPGTPRNVPPGKTDQHPKTPPTTPPVRTPPPSTPPSTPTPSPTCPPGQNGTPPNCLTPKGPVPYPSGKPPVSAPPGPVESSPPSEPNPANPSTKPGGEASGVPAPGASQEPTQAPKPSPIPQAPGPSSPGTSIPDPDSQSTVSQSPSSGGSVPVGGVLAALLIPGGLVLRRRREVDA